jgi:hypothetical protein
MNSRLVLPDRRNHLTQKACIGSHRTLYLTVHDDPNPAEVFLRVKGPDVTNETIALGSKHLRDSQRTLLGYTKVYAPFDGTITARFADPGALIQSATSSATQAAPLFTIMDMDTVRVYVSVPQEMAHLGGSRGPGGREHRRGAG